MTTIAFYTDAGPVGVVQAEGGELKADPKLQDLVDAHLRNGLSVAQFVERYGGWSNGYVWSEIDTTKALKANFERVGPGARSKLRPLMEHYRGMAHPFTACVRDNTERFGKDRAERICAVLKDLIEGTTRWRGRGKSGVLELEGALDDLVAELRDDDEVAAMCSFLEGVITNGGEQA